MPLIIARSRLPICQSPCVHVAKCKTCPPTALHADQTEAVGLLLRAAPTPVQVARINDRVFLVNASLGLYPELLEDREAYKARFGRSRWVAFVAACATLCAHNAGCDCTSRWVVRFATYVP